MARSPESVIGAVNDQDVPGIEYHRIGEAQNDFTWFESLGQGEKDRLRQELGRWTKNEFLGRYR